MRRHQPPSALPPNDPLSLLRAYDHESNPSRPIRSSPLTASTIHGLPLELTDRLRSFPLFASAPDSFLVAIGKFLRPQLFQPHEYILTEGDDAKAMYWLVRGSLRVTSRDGESTYAELKPGAFFGEIGILMDIPRTATIIAQLRSLVLKLNKEDLQKVLPAFPAVERAIRDEAIERLSILERLKKERVTLPATSGLRKRSRDFIERDVDMQDVGFQDDSNKRRKSPSPSLAEAAANSVLGSANLTVRQILQELPLFAGLPAEILHFLGVNAQPCSFGPFIDIITQGSQGRDVFFLVRGEVEVVTETPGNKTHEVTGKPLPVQRVRARLKPGQYFGEVTSLSLAPKRTATVRSINSVECLRITGQVLDELWKNWSSSLRQQVEQEAKRRLKEVEDTDIVLPDAPSAIDALSALPPEDQWKKSVPTVTFSNTELESAIVRDMSPVAAEPLDPDPFFSIDIDNVRAKSRRSSLAPPSPEPVMHDTTHRQPSPPSVGRALPPSPLKPRSSVSSLSPASDSRRPISRRPSVFGRPSSRSGRGPLPDSVLAMVFQYLDLPDLMRLRLVSPHWTRLLTTNPDIMQDLDLSRYNRRVTDYALKEAICPFVGSRARHVNINNCFHVTDDGFAALVECCGESVRSWRMRSVWDVTGQSILDLVNRAKRLEDIDLSNCRKVGDNLLARIVGWIVPQPPPGQAAPLLPPVPSSSRRPAIKRNASSAVVPQADQPAPGTVVGAAGLKRLTLSYCKHVQDRSMAHIAAHAANRLESIDLTRCTSVTDQGFQHWGLYNFPRLRKLVLADCTYLTDQAIVGIANAARGLKELDLSFCCALSDTATEVLSLGLTHLTHLDLAFCGSAVSDSSLRCIGLHLLELEYLSVRGCVRVTGQGVESVVDGCPHLSLFDVSQCKNLLPWLRSGGVQAVRQKGCKARFEVVADGSWRGSGAAYKGLHCSI
ncbi:RNI-like protein [Aureobasidium sp. EXF-12298]|nr:RNI-like protein [Aureobasidium sp. EXF-12298]KAI4751873.1 RNI-like protein [Aureobasidium sp. EXF-12344]KAI4777977.1 RNI-like protein [Aureobasidium sp. EXF-3400]